MRSRLVTGFLFVVMFLGTAHAACAATFSADLTLSQNGRVQSGRLYVQENAIRQELQLKNELQVIIVRLDRKLVWTLNPANHTFLEAAYLGTQADLGAFGVATEDIRETKIVGTENLNGYRCTVIRYFFADPRITMTQWVALKLGYPLKTEIRGAKGFNFVQEVKNIVETPAADVLFEIPSGYQKISFAAMDSPLNPGAAQ